MPPWQWLLIATTALLIALPAAMVIWIRRSGISSSQATIEMRARGLELVRLPGRLRRLARDQRVPKRARWLLIGLAVYIASPIDPIPDFLPVIGQLDEMILVPLVLIRVRRMIPTDVWDEYFPKPSGQPIGPKTRAVKSGSPISGSSG